LTSPLAAINVVLNSVSTGMDMAGFAPRYINIRRGAYILAILALCTTPWNVVSSAATFLAVISGLGILMSVHPLFSSAISD
jgi:NCS1 family nucleobase:cation symporter-1